MITRSAHSETYRLHFLAHFLTEWDNIWCGDEQTQTGHHGTTFLVKEMSAVLLNVSMNFSVGTHSDVHELI